VAPVFSFSFSRPTDFLAPAVFMVCSVASGLVSGRARDREIEALLARAQLDDLLDTSRLLQVGLGIAEIRAVLCGEVDRHGQAMTLYWRDDAGQMQAVAGIAAAVHTAAMARIAGTLIPTLRVGTVDCHRLGYDEVTLGVLVCGGMSQRRFPQAVDARGYAEGLARLANLALTREHLSEQLTEQRTLARVDQFQSALLMAVSHDLRSPLTAIGTAAASLAEFSATIDDQTRAELVQCIGQECRRLDRLTTNLMQLARLETPAIALNVGPLDVNSSLQHCLHSLLPELGQRQLALRLSDAAPVICAEPALFELAIGNVVQNAIKFSPPDSTVTLTSAISAGSCVITISDQGIGVAPDQQALVFRRFHRTDAGRARATGSGLGLAIARSFVEAVGGTIALASPGQDGNSTTVTITLPVLEQDNAA